MLLREITLLIRGFTSVIVLFVLGFVILWFTCKNIYTRLVGSKEEAGVRIKSKQKGLEGELRIIYELQKLNQPYKILHDLYIPIQGGYYTQVDIILFSLKGIFIVESKNYSCEIRGSKEDLYWDVIYGKYAKHRLYNPLIQNSKHIQAIINYLGASNLEDYRSLVVFGDAKLDVPPNTEYELVVTLSELVDTIANYKLPKGAPRIEYRLLQKQYRYLKEHCSNVSDEIRSQHESYFTTQHYKQKVAKQLAEGNSR